MGEIYRCCDNPQITYLAPVNININERTIGSVDVWRCAVCKKMFCEEKQLGIESLTETVGMPKIEDDEKWVVIISKLQKGKDKWKLVKLKQNGIIKYETADEKILDLKIEDYKIVDDYHNSFLVEDHLNRAVEIQIHLNLKVHINDIDGTQMAAKINGTFEIDNNSFEFLAIAFGRIGGQNIGVKLSEEIENELKTLEYNVDEVIDELQKKLISGNLSIPDGLKRESFIDD